MRLVPIALTAALASRGAAQATVAYAATLVNSVSGGQYRGTVLQHAGTARLTLDLDKRIGWKGASGFLSILGTEGPDADALPGDLQGVIAAEGPPGARLEEAWIQQNAFDNQVSLLVGRYDTNSEFYRLSTAAIFLNSSFGIGPELGLSGTKGPSIYPFTAVGARLDYKPSINSVVRTAVLDGVPVDRPDGGIHLFAPGDGIFGIGEISILSRRDTSATMPERRFRIGRGVIRPYAAKLAIGGWTYTTRLPDVVDTLANGAPRRHRATGGAYLIGDGTVWTAGAGSSATLAMFGQAGIGDPRTAEVGGYVGGGLVLTGPSHARKSDQVGFAVASAQIGSHFRRAQGAAGLAPSPAETTLELTYIADLAAWLAVQGDLQFVVHPGGTTARPNALVPGIQIAASHTFGR